MKNLTIDKEFKQLIPGLNTDEYQQLKKNILAEGCRDALVVWVQGEDNTLLDGHNRYEICQQNNVEFDVIPKFFDSREDAIEWIICNQFGRRNITNYERGVLALRLEGVYKAKAKDNQIRAAQQTNQKLSGTLPQNSAKAVTATETRREIAKIAQVSHDTIDKIKKIETMGTNDIKDQVRTGDMSIHKAYGLVNGTSKKKSAEQKRSQMVSSTSISNRLQVEKELKEIASSVNEKYNKEQRKLFISFIKI